MVINYLDKLFVTSDAATMLSEMEVQHPAAKMIVLAAKAQEAELGDGTNLVRAFPPSPIASEWSAFVRDGGVSSSQSIVRRMTRMLMSDSVSAYAMLIQRPPQQAAPLDRQHPRWQFVSSCPARDIMWGMGWMR